MPNNTGSGTSRAALDGTDRNRAWIERQTATPEDRREYEQERLILWATDMIYQAFTEQRQSKADVARSLGTSRANITQLLSGSRNITLRSLADLAWACDMRVSLSLEPFRYGEFVSTPMKLLRVSPRRQILCDEAMPVRTPADEDALLSA